MSNNSDKEEMQVNEEEIQKIIEESNKEYEEIQCKSKDKTKVSKILAVAILIMLVLLLRTIIKTNELTSSVQIKSEKISAEMDETGKITSKQHIQINQGTHK